MENSVKVDSRVTYFEMTHMACAIFNKNMMLLDINNKALQTFHLKREDIIHKKLIDIFPHIESTEIYEAYVQAIETGNPIDDKEKLIHKGKEYFFLVRAFKFVGRFGPVRKRVHRKYF